MAGISYVFTISRVAEMLGEDEEWLTRLASCWIRKTVVSAFSASAKTRRGSHRLLTHFPYLSHQFYEGLMPDGLT